MRKLLVVSNWKLNGSKQQVASFISFIKDNLQEYENCSVAVALPTLYFDQAAALLRDASKITLAAQNIDLHSFGGFTGEISALMLPEFGITHVLVGHCERRRYHQEGEDTVAKKLLLVKNAKMVPIVCIGETAEQKERKGSEAACVAQLANILNHLDSINLLDNLIIAYEPIWAIGSGRSACAQQAQSVHHAVRRYIAQQNSHIASQIMLLYGGSVDEHNVEKFCSMPDIDGVLVGGASLNPQAFTTIVHNAAAAKNSTLLKLS